MVSILSWKVVTCPSTTLKTAEAVRGKVAGFNSCGPSSGCSAVPEGCVPSKVAGQEISGRCKFLADEAQAEEPGSHGVFGVFVLLGLGACGAHILCHLGKRQAKLDVALELSGVDAAPALCGRLIKLEEPKLDRPFGKGGVEVEHMVAAVVVVVVSAVVCAVAGVPDVRKLGHRAGLPAVDLL